MVGVLWSWGRALSKEVTCECGLEGPGASCVHTVGKGGPWIGQMSAQALKLE